MSQQIGVMRGDDAAGGGGGGRGGRAGAAAAGNNKGKGGKNADDILTIRATDVLSEQEVSE